MQAPLYIRAERGCTIAEMQEVFFVNRIFFIADTHFGSEAIRRYENRPFSDAAEMDRVMIDRWNRTVTAEDIVYHLGDFGAEGREAEILARLNGTIYLVKGNHDTQSNDYYRRAGFREVYDLPVLFQNFWILSHEPLYVNTNMPYANLFGHVHANPQYRDFSPQHFCVCAERIGYNPIPLAEITRKITE